MEPTTPNTLPKEISDLASDLGLDQLISISTSPAQPPSALTQSANDLLSSFAQSAANRRRHQVVFGSACMNLMYTRCQILASALPVDIPVTITGPTGSGKEVFARALHTFQDQPFVALNMAAIPENLIASLLFGHIKGSFTGASESTLGAFRAARTGTVFLDEIGDMPAALQPILLRVLEERTVTPVGDPASNIPISCRIVCATNCDLNDATKFRPDLYARLNVIRFDLPGLTDPRREGCFDAIGAHYELTQQDLSDIRQSPELMEYVARFNVRALKTFAARKKYLGYLSA